jgi:hypothetical protein
MSTSSGMSRKPTPHTVYFFAGVAAIFLDNRGMLLERRLSNLQETAADARNGKSQ